MLTAFYYSGTAFPAAFTGGYFIGENFQEKAKTNLEIFEKRVSEGLQKIIYYPGVDRNIEFIFVISQAEIVSGKTDDQKRFLAGTIKKTASAEKLKISFIEDPAGIRTDSQYNLVTIKIYGLWTGYPGFKKNKFLGEKTLIRNIKIKIGVDVRKSDGKFSLSDQIESDYTDEIQYDDYEAMENPQYSFTSAFPPDVGVFETIAFPVLLILVSATATVLFFVIRSK